MYTVAYDKPDCILNLICSTWVINNQRIFTNKVGFLDTELFLDNHNSKGSPETRIHSFSVSQLFAPFIKSLEYYHHTYPHLNRSTHIHIWIDFMASPSQPNSQSIHLENMYYSNWHAVKEEHVITFKVLQGILFLIRLECYVCTCVSHCETHGEMFNYDN